MELHELPSGTSFHVWDYHVGHCHLNLRCSRVISGELEDHNIDIVFGGVRYMELPNSLMGLTFDQPTAEERTHLESRCRLPDLSSSEIRDLPANEIHVLVANGQR
jgi:hypothetical protein